MGVDDEPGAGSGAMTSGAFRATRGKPPSRPRDFKHSDPPSDVCFARERARTQRCAAHRRPDLGRSPHDPWRTINQRNQQGGSTLSRLVPRAPRSALSDRGAHPSFGQAGCGPRRPSPPWSRLPSAWQQQGAGCHADQKADADAAVDLLGPQIRARGVHPSRLSLRYCGRQGFCCDFVGREKE